MSARLAMKYDKTYSVAEQQLEGLLQKNIPDYLFRMAGFDLVKLFDKSQRYEEAWQLAEKIHARNKHIYPLTQLQEALMQVATIPDDVVRQIRGHPMLMAKHVSFTDYPAAAPRFLCILNRSRYFAGIMLFNGDLQEILHLV